MSDITVLQNTGASSQRIDLVFVAEGYQSSDRGKFLADAAAFKNMMLADSNSALNAPFSSYKNYFNVSALFVASNQSGLDTATLGVDTYFGAAQHGSDGRLVYGDSAKVQSEVRSALASDAHEMTVVLVNSSLYGGAGGSIAWATTGNKSSSEVLLHEIGHSFASLEDEYADASLIASYPLTSLDSVHLTSSLSQLPWSRWLGYTDALGTVGTYEGGYYRSTGVWRATPDSKMLHLGVAFSAPEKEAFALAYYNAIGDYLSFDTSIPGLVCSVEPDPSLLWFAWTVNGQPASSISSTYLDLYGSGMKIGNCAVQLSTVDKTGYIRNGLAISEQTELATVSAPARVSRILCKRGEC